MVVTTFMSSLVPKKEKVRVERLKELEGGGGLIKKAVWCLIVALALTVQHKAGVQTDVRSYGVCQCVVVTSPVIQ